MFTDIQTSTDTIDKFKEFTTKREVSLNSACTCFVQLYVLISKYRSGLYNYGTNGRIVASAKHRIQI